MYEPQKAWEISNYIVCIDGLGLLTNTSISNLPPRNFIFIHPHRIIENDMNVTNVQFELTIRELNTDKTWKHKGATLNQKFYYEELKINSTKYSDAVYSSSVDD